MQTHEPLSLRPAALAWAASDARLAALLERFEPIRLDEMDSVALMDRIDTKYLLAFGDLLKALETLSGDYRALDIEGVRLSPYQTLYFDTPGLALFRQHQTGRARRCKVRSRRYASTGRAFVEVKLKTRGDRTTKRRLETAGLITQFSPELRDFVGPQAGAGPALLRPTLANAFSRITLVGRNAPERVTIDVDLCFASPETSIAKGGFAIIELKQPRFDRAAPFARFMRELGARPTGFSKYGCGVAWLYPTVQHNHFMPALRAVDTLIRGNNHVQ